MDMVIRMVDVWTVFTSGFLSSTLLPGNSEVVFYYYLKASEADPFLLLFAVSIGNILGAFTNYLAGRGFGKGLKIFQTRKVKLIGYRKPIKYIRKYEKVSLFCSFLPWIGDPITFVAGVIKVKYSSFIVWVSIGKFCRYSFLWLIEAGL